MVKIIDLSIPVEDSPSEPLPVKVTHEPHKQGVKRMKTFFGCSRAGLAGGAGLG